MTDNLSLKVKEICPYYFDLEEKFLEQAGIKPSATSEEIFRESDDNEVIKVETYNGEELEEGKNQIQML
jgi:beta-lactam-binding protein with PASTA domain